MHRPSGRTSRCVLLFARTPVEEARAKGLRGAAALFELSERRLAAALAGLHDVDVAVAGDAGPNHPFRSATTLPQRGRSFGERLVNAFADVRALGYAEIVAVPIDVPLLGTEQLLAAFDRLAAHDHVLGPSPDGGVYLIGTRTDGRTLFRDVPWQTDRVFLALLKNAGEAVVLGALLDVDHRADLDSLAGDPALDPELRRLLGELVRNEPAHRPVSLGAALRLLLAASVPGRSPPLLLSF